MDTNLLFSTSTFSCAFCEKMYATYSELQKHVQEGHREANKFLCSLCNISFDRNEDLQKHLVATHISSNRAANKFQCSLCNISFNGNEDLQRHLVATHISSRKFKCPICSKRFESKLSFDCHIQDHEQGTLMQNSDGSGLAAGTVSKTAETLFCNFCGETFNREEHLQQHLDRHFQMKLYECGICNSRFAGPFFLKHHMAVHKAARSHVCSQCGTGYRQKDMLIKHFRIHGVPKMENRIEQLQQVNTTEDLNHFGALTTHLENDTDALVNENFEMQRNTDELNFGDLLQTCESEGNGSTSDADMNYVTKIRPLTEDMVRNTALPNDTSHPNQIKDEPLPISDKAGDYTLLQPNQSTSQEPTFDARRADKGKGKMIYPCDLCNKVFGLKAHCQRHRRIHTGEMPYECNVCRRKFKWRSSLVTHSCLKSKKRTVEGFTTSSNVYRAGSEGLLNDHGQHVSDGYLDVTGNANNAHTFATEVSQQSDMSVHDGLYSDGATSGVPMESQGVIVDRMQRNFGAKRTVLYDQISGANNDAVHQKPLQRSTKWPISSKTRQPTLFTKHRTASTSLYSNTSRSTVNLVNGKQRKLFVCEFCSKVSMSRNHYLRHRRLHTGEKPFECDRCNRKFMWKSSLDSHMNSHEKNDVNSAIADEGSVRNHGQSDEAVQEHSDWIPEIKVERDSDETFDYLQCGNDSVSGPEFKSDISLHDDAQDSTKLAPDSDGDMTLDSYLSQQVTQQQNVDVQENLESASAGTEATQNKKKFIYLSLAGKLDSGSSGAEAEQNKNKFVCEYCNKSFKHLSSYQRHQPLHTGEMLHHCDVCNRKFKWKSSLDSHKKSHDKKEGSVSSHDFNPFLGPEQPGELMQEHLDGTPKDIIKSFEDKVFVCVVCGMGFASEMHLQSHELTHEVTNSYAGSLVRTKTDVGPFSGKAKAVPKANNSKKPKRQQQPHTKTTDQPTYQADMVHGQKKKNFVCEVCSKVFHIKHHYQRHFRIHSGEMPYQCEQCHKNFKWRSSFDCHMRSHKRSNNKKNGPVASTTSSDYVSLIANELTQGTTEAIPQQKDQDEDSSKTTRKPFVCPQCGTDYESDLELHIHMFTHGDEEYLKEQGYAGGHEERTEPGESSGPSLHMAQSSTAKDLPHQMQLLGPRRTDKYSTRKSGMTSSEMTASGNRDKHTKTKSTYTPSAKSSKNNQTKQGFPCEICGKVFKCRTNYQRHMPIHTGEMPFECDRCNRKFKWKSSLDSHKKSHEKKDLDISSIEQVSFIDSEEDL